MTRLPGVLSRITRLEIAAAGVTAAVMAVLIVLEPDVLEAPFENGRTMAFVAGGTAAAAIALLVMLRFGVPAPLRIIVLGVPFVAVSWWLISPFFVDDVVEDTFETSIAAGRATPTTQEESAAAPAEPSTEPVLLGSGAFVGLAGHDGEGDAGFFGRADGSLVLRLENVAIDNGPDLRLYVVPGADQTDPVDGALYLGKLRGNVGNQTYELPADFELSPGDWTVLVWCEAFSVEFVAATVAV